MKKIITLVALLATVTLHAQSDKYTAAIQKTLALLDSAKTSQDLESVSATFERIGDAEKTQWLPYYYSALALTNLGWADQKVEKDKLAEKTKAIIAKAAAIEDNAELYTLRNMVATQQMLVDPQTRWQNYGMEASSALKKGLELDPNNPRLYYLQGMSLFGTPVQFGGGKDKAKPLFQKALELYKTAQPKPLYPSWGQKQSEQKLAECNS